MKLSRSVQYSRAVELNIMEYCMTTNDKSKRMDTENNSIIQWKNILELTGESMHFGSILNSVSVKRF